MLQGHGQGCVKALQSSDVSYLPLLDPTGVQLAPTSQKLVEEEFSEVRLPSYGVLGSSPGKFQGPPIWGTESVDPHALGELHEGNRPR